MQQLNRTITHAIHRLSSLQRFLLLSLSVLTLSVVFWHAFSFCPQLAMEQPTPQPLDLLPQDSEPLDQPLSDVALAFPTDELDQAVVLAKGQGDHIVAQGDTLSTVLMQYGVALGDIYLLVKRYPLLRHLGIGQRLSWTLDQQGRLQQLCWQRSTRTVQRYQRVGNRFQLFNETLQGTWRQQCISGFIRGNFITSARVAGLTMVEIQQAIQALQWRLDFRRLRPGDKFKLLLNREYLQGGAMQSQLIGALFQTRQGEYYAIRAADGHFYDRQGGSLSKGFLRLPTLTSYPISSHFNPQRRHPITGRVAPHNGVDFVMPQGTPVVTIGDGQVVQTGYSASAGNYVVIRHGRQYVTRYFHLRKILVKNNQCVKRGERIGLSGNSGRSTGPHLHFELHVNNRPVNPVTVNLPPAEHLDSNEQALFLARANVILAQML